MIVLASGHFDPLHDGHLDYLEGAKEYGRVVVALNSDKQVMRKKKYLFMPWTARARILRALKVVYEVVRVNDEDGTVCEALRTVRPQYFVNGGDRTQADPREHAICIEFGIEEIFGVGGRKVRSSSDIMPRSMRSEHYIA